MSVLVMSSQLSTKYVCFGYVESIIDKLYLFGYVEAMIDILCFGSFAALYML